MSIQSPMKYGLYIRQVRPDRRWIRISVKYYSYIVGALISVIVMASLYPLHKPIMLLFVGGYWVYLFSWIRLRKRERWLQLTSQTVFEVLRVAFLIACVTLLLFVVYSQTQYLQLVNNDALWLLYFPAVLAVSQRGSRSALLLVLAVIIVCIYMVSPSGGTVIVSLPKPVSLELIARCLWLVFLSFTTYVLLRYMTDAIADLNLIINIQNRMREMEGKFLPSRMRQDENDYLEKVVEIIRDDLGYDHVNIFRLDKPSNKLTCVAGACADGKRLVREGYKVDQSRQNSIIGHVARTGRGYVTNNAAHDAHFLQNDAFPKTRAELVVPIEIRGRLYGVLDIQVHQADYFLDQDLKAIEILANHIGWVIDNSMQYDHIRWVNRIIETIAAPIFTQNHLEETLQEIADTARQELGADLVLLYSFDPGGKDRLLGPIYSGLPLHPELIQRPTPENDNVVYRMLSAEESIYLNEDLTGIDLENHPIFSPSTRHRLTGRPTFIEREKVKANAIVRLLNKEQCVGVLFLNFLAPHAFNAWEKRRYFSFAHLASLAIQKMHLQQRIIQTEMAGLSNMIHDMLIGDTAGLFKILNSIDLSGRATDLQKARERLEVAKDTTARLHNDIRHVNNLLKDKGSDDLLMELDKLYVFIRQVFKCHTQSTWTGDTRSISPRLSRELLLVMREAITNAARHGPATEIRIAGEIAAEELRVSIVDNGTGFDPAQVRRMNGLLSMQGRIEELAGEFKLNSNPGKGTKIFFKVPLKQTVEV
jgi:signal transduction histidine kinase